jgi:hypothetical protein
MAPSLEATAKAGHDPSNLARALGDGLGSKAITHRELGQHVLVGEDLPKKWSHADVVEHALKVKGVPRFRIPAYQRMLIREGHFPNAGLVQELHKAHLRERRRKRGKK